MKIGSVLDLYWDEDPPKYYIYGHLDFNHAKSILREWIKHEDREEKNIRLENPRHVYGRWIRGRVAWSLDCDSILREYDNSARGSFKLTVFEVK